MTEAERIKQRISRQPSEIVKRQLRQTITRRDAVPRHDLRAWDYWNGRADALQGVIREFQTNETPTALKQ